MSLPKLDVEYYMYVLLFLQSGLVVFIRCQRITTHRRFNSFMEAEMCSRWFLVVGSGIVQVLECEAWVLFLPSRCPLVSLSYIPRATSAVFPYGGVLAGTLENASFWELKTGCSHRSHVLPIEPGGCIDFQTESSTRHCLVTYRPGECWNALMRPPVICLGARLWKKGKESFPYPSVVLVSPSD